MVAPLTFTAKFGLVFVLTQENALSQRFHFIAKERTWILLNNGTRDFQNGLPFERSVCVYVTTTECFHYFTFETNFLKNGNLFKKLEKRFLVQSTEIESAISPHKTAMPEANVKTNRMEVHNGAITKDGVLPVPTLLSFFLLYIFLFFQSKKHF